MNGRLLTGTPFIYQLFNASISACYGERILLRSLLPRQEIVCRDVREHRALFQDPRHLHDVGTFDRLDLIIDLLCTVGEKQDRILFSFRYKIVEPFLLQLVK
jgi:hypothetical protein